MGARDTPTWTGHFGFQTEGMSYKSNNYYFSILLCCGQ